jgi:hypothetical protein
VFSGKPFVGLTLGSRSIKLSLVAWRGGYGFSPNGREISITLMLLCLLRLADYQYTQNKAYALEQSSDTET